MNPRPRAAIAVISVASVLLVGRWIVEVRKPLSSRVEVASEAMLRGDGKALFAYASQREVEQEGLTPAKLQAVLDRLLVPQIARKVGTSDHEDDTGDFHALSVQKVLTKDGRTVPVFFELWSGQHGLETNVLGTVLGQAWDLRLQPAGGYAKPSDYFEAGVRGIREDTAFLTSVGLHGVASRDPSKPFTTWERLEARDRQKVVDHRDASFSSGSG